MKAVSREREPLINSCTAQLAGWGSSVGGNQPESGRGGGAVPGRRREWAGLWASLGDAAVPLLFCSCCLGVRKRSRPSEPALFLISIRGSRIDFCCD